MQSKVKHYRNGGKLMKKKVLILASVASMIDQFNMSNIEILLDLGYEVHVACNFEKGSTCTVDKIEQLKIKLKNLNVRYFQIDFTRSVYNIVQDIKAYKQVKQIAVMNNYEFIHCHSPIGGVIGRLVCQKEKLKCIYTAHGFHFFKGGPKKNWIVFYPIEKWLSKYTDTLITINEEDYRLATTKFRAKECLKVPGVGVDVKKYQLKSFNKDEYRKKIGLKKEDFVILSVGELSKRKNHNVIVKAISQINNTNIKYLIVGKGQEKDNLEKLIQDLKLNDQIFLLGFRDDIPELCNCSNVFAFPSRREGLGLAAIEGMAAGLPIVTSNINGINDYSIYGQTGFSYKPDDIKGFKEGIEKLIENPEIIKKISINNKKKSELYDFKNVNEIMRKLYLKYRDEIL